MSLPALGLSVANHVRHIATLHKKKIGSLNRDQAASLKKPNL